MPELICNGKRYAAQIGRGRLIAAEKKREGDGCTPMGVFPLRECWYRADRLPPPATALPLHIIHEDDCWCDDPADARYNRYFCLSERTPPLTPRLRGGELSVAQGGDALPHSFEHLWREDHAYDLIIPLGYNDAPPIPGKGSAIFLHCMHDDHRPTAGCVALNKNDLLELLPILSPQNCLSIAEGGIVLLG